MNSPIEWWQHYVADSGGEKPSRLAQVLAETIPVEPHRKTLLDIGCGSGIIGLYCLLEKKVHAVTFADVMPSWVEITSANVALKIQEGAIARSQVTILKPTSFDRIASEVIARHDTITFNLPQFPENYVEPVVLARLAADPVKAGFRLAGPDGLKLARDFVQWYSSVKHPKPDAIFVLWSILGRRQIIEVLNAGRFQWRIIKETIISLKPEFFGIAAQYFQNPHERENRMLAKDQGGWTIHVLTIQLTGI